MADSPIPSPETTTQERDTVPYITGKDGLEIARAGAPTFYQRLKSSLDCIVPIHTGDFIPDLISKPAIYYSVLVEKEFTYCLYCVFHRRDWSELPWPIKSLDEHEFDLEGVLHAKGSPLPSERYDARDWSASVSHRNLKFTKCRTSAWVIEPGGHGISPPHPMPDEAIWITYHPGAYKLIDINRPRMQKWMRGSLQTAFNRQSVSMPWQWNDWRIRKRFGRDTDGYIYSDPASLRKMADELELI